MPSATVVRSARVRAFTVLSLCAFLMLAVHGPALPSALAISADPATLTSHACNHTEFRFTIDRLDFASNAPSSILLTFTQGSLTKEVQVSLAAEDVTQDLSTFTYTAAYHVSVATLLSEPSPFGLKGSGFNLSDALSLTSATADMLFNYDKFVMVHGPCPNPGMVIPEVPVAAVYPLLGVATFGLAYTLRRRRAGRA
jgi:hypothetical protein